MRRILLIAGLLALGLAGAGRAAAYPATSAADFAACESGDQAVCLLKLSTRGPATPLETEVALAYAPDLIKAAAPEPSSDDAFNQVLASMRPRDAAAVAVLRADAAGASPAAALDLLETYRKPAGRHGEAAEKLSVSDRMDVYVAILELAGEPVGRGRNHGPSSALLAALEAAACRDLSTEEGQDSAAKLVRLQVAAGRAAPMRACLLAVRQPGWRLADGFLAAGLWDAAVAALSSPISTSGVGGEFERLSRNSVRMDAIAALDKAGRRDQALALARVEVEDALAAPDPAPDLKPQAGNPLPVPEGVHAGGAVRLLAKYGPRAEVLGLLERLDAAARTPRSLKALVLAGLAVRGWTDTGEPARAKALMTDLLARTEGCTDPKVCVTPQMLDFIVAMTGSTPDQGLPQQLTNSSSGLVRGLSFLVAMSQGRRDILDARLASADPRDRRRAINDCLTGAARSQPKLASYCAGLIEADAGLGEDNRILAVKTFVEVAAQFAREGDLTKMRAYLGRAFRLAKASGLPRLDLSESNLRQIAIVELREQGRL